ncbi:MAG TPA: tRNA (adenosine(37)-N6)-threonylcarbamoyltransferase complex dimerization subunit type 1 TsaB [Vicinamibacterales bacterium]|nr:tRNA (adenosine(37)-N6)-threonylcarbamoyltransferase complex dimerization subunit type 1 TsaB [Vicinamibacterales bacterium]
MLVLALDTTTRLGSLAIARDDRLLDAWSGDGALTHAARLPGDILDGLRRQGLAPADIDLYGVAAGPGSFTGLRIGIATIQGLAFAHERPVAGVSALEALAWAARDRAEGSLIASWMDARRDEVFASLSGGDDLELRVLAGPQVGGPDLVLAAWDERLADRPVLWLGDGALVYAPLIRAAARGRSWTILPEVPALAPAIAALALRRAARGETTRAHGVRPVYIRRPDAELARDRRRRQAASAGGAGPDAKGKAR